DPKRPVLFSGQTQLLTPAGVLPLVFEIEADTLDEALTKFPEGVNAALEQAIDEAREMRRESASRIVVPEVGAGGIGPGPGPGAVAGRSSSARSRAHQYAAQGRSLGREVNPAGRLAAQSGRMPTLRQSTTDYDFAERKVLTAR